MNHPPNVILIHWHDLGTHLGCYGARGVESPHVDRLAEQGVTLTQAHCSAPQCSPARGALMTGTYPHQNGLMGLVNRGWSLPPSERTLPMFLGEFGYRTALIGVQHESRDARTLGYQQILALGEQTAGGRCDPVSRAAARWLRDRSVDGERGKPFFASIGFYETHRPYPAERYPPADQREVHVPEFLPDDPWVREDLAAFQGSIRAADAAVGRIVDVLERTGLEETTWVVFTSDHGMAFPGAKGTLYDPGTRVALVMRPPRGSSPDRVGTSSSRLISHIDLLPTVLDLAGAPVPDHLEGVSHAPWLMGGEQKHARTKVFTEKTHHDYYDPMRALRTHRYKYIRSFEQRPRMLLPGDVATSISARGYGSAHWEHRRSEELYDLDADPLERHNLIDDGDYAATRDELASELLRWQQDTDDPILRGPVPAAAWAP